MARSWAGLVAVAVCAATAHGRPVTRRAVGLGMLPITAAIAARADTPPPTSISYAELTQRLATCKDLGVCDVTRVEFTAANGESGYAVIGEQQVPITDIPREDPTNDSSPLRLVAKLRDAKVPYTFPFSDLSRFRNR